METHPDYAVPVTREMHAETCADPGDGLAPIAGPVVALGWWTTPRVAADPKDQPTDTLYLVVDPRRPRPYWIAEGDLTSVRVR